MNERIGTPIPDAELERRWAALRAAMAVHGFDAIVCQSSNDWLGGAVKWLTDMPATNGYPRTVLFFAEGPMTVVEMGPFGQHRTLGGSDPVHRGVGDIHGTPAFLSVAYTHEYEGRLASDSLRQHGSRRVGIVGRGGLPHGLVTLLEREHTLGDATDLLDEIKAIKSDVEIKLIRRTAEVQDEVFAAVLAGIRPGIRDIDVTALAQHEGQIRGSEQGIFLGCSARLGRAAGFQPRHLQARQIEPGDHFSLLIEINGPGGFYTELARTIVLGRASAELLEGFAAVREAQEHTLSLLRPGALPAEIAFAHDAYMRSRGLPPELRLYSHGQGYDMVERPLIRHDETMPIAERMCVAVHPGYETPSLFAVICDNYLIGSTGVGDCLHRTEKKVFEV
ncbi:MAG: aminopeptidase P family protein [Proteobacteria bacterium]|nr:aminopeptidase P family protein [Pseudomonadota bacterium]